MGKPSDRSSTNGASNPRFKKKGRRDSFCAANEAGTFRTDGKRIKLPVVGWGENARGRQIDGKQKRVAVSRQADRWFASIMVEAAEPVAIEHPGAAIGVDLGVTVLATLSTGEEIAGPKPHKAMLKRLRRANKALCA